MRNFKNLNLLLYTTTHPDDSYCLQSSGAELRASLKGWSLFSVRYRNFSLKKPRRLLASLFFFLNIVNCGKHALLRIDVIFLGIAKCWCLEPGRMISPQACLWNQSCPCVLKTNPISKGWFRNHLGTVLQWTWGSSSLLHKENGNFLLGTGGGTILHSTEQPLPWKLVSRTLVSYASPPEMPFFI